MEIIDIILFIIIAIFVCYLAIFKLASCFHVDKIYHDNEKFNKFMILFPAYKEDKVIIESVITACRQSYPKDKFDIYVASDGMNEVTNNALET